MAESQENQSKVNVYVIHSDSGNRPWGIYLNDVGMNLITDAVIFYFDHIADNLDNADEVTWRNWRGMKDIQAKVTRAIYENTTFSPVTNPQPGS